MNLTVGLAAGAFLDSQGNPNAAFDDGTVAVDYTSVPFPTPLAAGTPLGSLTYSGSFSATVGYAGDTDSFTLNLDANQTLNLIVPPDINLQPTITVTGPGVNRTAASTAAGASVQLNLIPIATAGTYTFTVGGVGATTGSYTIQAVLNLAQEAESNGGSSNDTPATAQSLATALLNLGGGLASATVQGRSDAAGVVTEVEPNGTTATATPAGTYSSASASNLYQLGISGSLSSTADGDYFNIGTMQVGDVLTISEGAAGSGRGTGTDPFVELYRAGSATPVASDDDSGPGTDSLIYRFTVATADTYYVHAYRFDTTATPGTYQLGVLLENSGSAPNTGATFTTESEPNDTIATADDASNAWRSVKYNATAAGTRASGDTDIFSYQFTAGDVVTLITHSTSSLSPRAELLNSAGAVLAADLGANNGSAVATAGGLAPIYAYVIPTTGTYYFRVTAGTSTGTYTADVSLSTTATLPTVPPAQDLYSFGLAAGQSASAVVNSSTPGALDVAILDTTGAPAATGVVGATNVDEIVSNYVAPIAGTYYMRISGPANIDYQATVVTGGTFDAEPNDSFATAQTLATGSSALGAISGSDDWYQLNLAAGSVLTLTTTTPGGGPGEFTNTLDPAIELYDPNNVLVGSDDNSAADGRNATLTRTAALAGSYRVHITGAGGTTGEYTLNSNVAVAAPTVAGVQVGDGSGQRSEVRSLIVTFSGPVTFAGGNVNAAAAFQLLHVQTGNNVDLASAVSMDALGRTVVTLSFSGAETDAISAQNSNFASLADGRYSLTILSGSVTGPGGTALDGDGNGAPGGNYVSPTDTLGGGAGQLHLYRIFGDTNGDGIVDQQDLGQFRSTFNTSAPNPLYIAFLDANYDGNVDQQDLGQFRTRFNANVF
jgi:hypothetical protein